MAVDLTASALYAAVRRDAMLGNATATSFPTNDDILAFLNEEMPNCLIPALIKPREERYVAIEEFSTVENLAEYDIPARATWLDLRDVQVYVEGSSPPAWVSLNQIAPEQGSAMNWPTPAQNVVPAGYYMQADQIVLVPTPTSVFTCRFKYYRRPGQIIASGYATITELDFSHDNLWVAHVASNTGMVAGLFDIVTGTTYSPVLDDLSGTLSGGDAVVLTLTEAQAAVITAAVSSSAGAVILGSGDSPIAQIPQELVPLLTHRAAARALQAKKDFDGANALWAFCNKIQKDITTAMQPREGGLPKHVVVSYGPGLNTRWGWGGYGGGGGLP